MTNQPVQGRRSPRWAFWTHMTIPCEDGLIYLARLRIIQTPWFGVYLHDIYEPDGDRSPHNHPWSFVSVMLKGGYTERFHPDPERNLYRADWRTYKRGSIHRMGRRSGHQIVKLSGHVKTLIITGPRKSNWGFFTKQGWMPWQEYERTYGLEER